MRWLVAIILFVAIAARAMAQPSIWFPTTGKADNLTNQRAAIQAVVDEFVARLQSTALRPPMTQKADVYPSERAAVEAMADDFAAKLLATPGFDPRQSRVIIGEIPPETPNTTNGSMGLTSESRSISSQSGPQVTTAATRQAIGLIVPRLQRQLHAKIVGGKLTNNLAPNEVGIGICLENVERIERSGELAANGYHGRLRATLTRGEMVDSFEAEFVDKPWVNEWAMFINLQPSKTWVVGRSSQICTNEVEADIDACNDAASQLARLVQTRIPQEGVVHMPFETIQSMIVDQLRTHGSADRFVQRIDHPYGSTWQASILVSTTDESLGALSPQIAGMVRQQEKQAITTFAAISILTIVIIALYLFLNGVTKGYFTWRLRMAALVILVVGGMFLLLGSLFFVGLSRAPQAHVQINR